MTMGSFLFVLCCAQAADRSQVSLRTLLEEMSDLETLARLPQIPCSTVQFSSFDRRSTGVESADWLSNADGFGNEPIPGFQKVLREPVEDTPGLYLVAEVEGPGAIVRGWSAGMDGVMTVRLDGDEKPLFQGQGYDFLARRSKQFLEQAELWLETEDAFNQQDADYFPVPFAKSLRVTWEGRIVELHFYHLEVRRYAPDIRVKSFAPERDVMACEKELRAAIEHLTQPRTSVGFVEHEFKLEVAPGERQSWSPQITGPAAVSELSFTVAKPADELLRGVRMQIAFDSSQRPQVEAPLGDFFGSGPGLNFFDSLPLSVQKPRMAELAGWPPPPTFLLTSRWVMPFQSKVEFHWWNTSSRPLAATCTIRTSPWSWDERSLYFRARWRADHDLVTRDENKFDLPFVMVRGKGRFVGAAAMVVNPAVGPHAGGNWWGEGDEKIFIDDAEVPQFFGTGSEDYFNYSWSRSDLFDHPYCGQPLDSGPDTAGYVSNHRFHVLDSLTFDHFFAFFLEMWQHRPSPGLSYSRIAYLYARPGALDDHRAIVASDLVVPPLPPRTPEAVGAATGSTIHLVENLKVTTTGRPCESVNHPLSPRGKFLQWDLQTGELVTIELPIEAEGSYEINLVMLHCEHGAFVRFHLDDQPLELRENKNVVAILRTQGSDRVLNVRLDRRFLTTGTHRLAIECQVPGPVAVDYLWVQPIPKEE